jgi:hypothetical protein
MPTICVSFQDGEFQKSRVERSNIMRRFLLPLAILVALGLSAGTAQAQVIVSSPYTGVYSSGYLSVSPSGVYVTPSTRYYSNYYPSGYYSAYYPSSYYGSSYYYPSYSYGSSYYSSPYWGTSYSYPSWRTSSQYWDNGWGWRGRGWRWRY